MFKVEVHRVLASGKSRFIAKVGYYDTDPRKKTIAIRTNRLGFWLNKGAKVNLVAIKF